MDAKARLERILKKTGTTYNSFAKGIGMQRSQVLYDIRDGRIKDISASLATLIVKKYPEFNQTWLLTGEGDMLNNSEMKKEEIPSEGGVIEQLVASNKLLAEAARKHAEANIKFAEGQLTLARNQEALLKMAKGATASGLEVALQAFGTKLAAIEDVFSAELTKGRSDELERIREALHNKEVEIQELIKHVSNAEGAGI